MSPEAHAAERELTRAPIGSHVATKRRRRGAPPSTTAMLLRAVVVALIGALISGLVLLVAFNRLAHGVASTRALARAHRLGQVDTRTVFAPFITNAVLAGDPGALADLDDVARRYLRSSGAVRVKVWTAEGQVVYSDEQRLIGRHFTLDPEEAEAFDNGRSKSEFSDLLRPENEYERALGRVLEVYVPTATESGTVVLIETYYPFALVEESAADLRRHYVPVVSGTAALLALAQLPVSIAVALRLQRNQRTKARLLASLLAVSDTERRRIAGEIHDGAVQDLIGLGFALGGVAQRAPASEAEPLRELTDGLASVTEQLRHLLTTIYPLPTGRGDIGAVIGAAADQLRASGIEVDLDLDTEQLNRLNQAEEAIVLRTINELLHNVRAHSQATAVDVTVRRGDADGTVVAVADNGTGLTTGSAASPSGHFGLRLLNDLARDTGGSLHVVGTPTGGTTVTLELPCQR